MKKYVFWIVCGIVFVGVIVAWWLLVPIEEAREAKRSLDGKTRDLNRLVERAERGSPQGTFDPEKLEDTKRLAEEYLITDEWQRVLQPLVKKYEEQLEGVTAHLVARHGWLTRRLAPTKNVLEWYNEYIAVSEALIDRLRAGGVLRPAADDEQRSPLGESPANVRQAVGLFTKGTEYPPPRDHLRLTVRLRAMELIGERLLKARVPIADNPLLGPTGLSSERAVSVPRLTSVEWLNTGASGGEEDDGLRAVSTEIAGRVQPRALGLRLAMEGSLGAVLAGMAALERNAELDRPLVTIVAAQLTRREQVRAGERFDAADDRVLLNLALEVIEFVPTVAVAGRN